MGAIGGPCNGHLALSQMRLVEASAVRQLNSSPCLSQTWPESPAQNVFYQNVLIADMRGFKYEQSRLGEYTPKHT